VRFASHTTADILMGTAKPPPNSSKSLTAPRFLAKRGAGPAMVGGNYEVRERDCRRRAVGQLDPRFQAPWAEKRPKVATTIIFLSRDYSLTPIRSFFVAFSAVIHRREWRCRDATTAFKEALTGSHRCHVIAGNRPHVLRPLVNGHQTS